MVYTSNKYNLEELKDLRINKDIINSIKGIKLDDMKKVVNAYTLEDFPYTKDSLPCVILLLPHEGATNGHYVSLCQNSKKDKLYYFDSYGYNPLSLFQEHPEMMNAEQDINKWGEFLTSFKEVVFNSDNLQDDNSELCGYYCITYIYEAMSKVDFDPVLFSMVIQRFSKNYKMSPDNVILLYYSNVITDTA